MFEDSNILALILRNCDKISQKILRNNRPSQIQYSPTYINESVPIHPNRLRKGQNWLFHYF